MDIAKVSLAEWGLQDPMLFFRCSGKGCARNAPGDGRSASVVVQMNGVGEFHLDRFTHAREE
jgi:hypothetical protein